MKNHCEACIFEEWVKTASAEDLEASNPPIYEHTCDKKQTTASEEITC